MRLVSTASPSAKHSSLLVAICGAIGALAYAGPASAEPPGDAPPPPSAPADAVPSTADPPIVGAAEAPSLPEGVTAIDDPRVVTFVLSGGNRIVARRIGEDAEYVWVETDGRQARVRKAEIVTMEFQIAPGVPTAPPVTATPPSLSYAPPPRPAPRGRSMVIWGSILLGAGYTLAVAAALDESTGDDGTSFLLAIPLVGPFIFAGTDAAGGDPGPWIVDGLLQAGGLVLLYLGIRRMSEPEPPPQVPRVGLSVGRHGAFARATWAL